MNPMKTVQDYHMLQHPSIAPNVDVKPFLCLPVAFFFAWLMSHTAGGNPKNPGPTALTVTVDPQSGI
jgi:hypothetical protein